MALKTERNELSIKIRINFCATTLGRKLILGLRLALEN